MNLRKKREEEQREPLIDPRTKGIIFFVVYGIFFAVLILALRNHPVEEKPVDDRSYSFQRINALNYHFQYTLEENGNTIIYEGDRLQEKAKFTMQYGNTQRTFFDNNGTVLEYIDKWSLSEGTPYYYPEFLDVKTINQLIKNGKFLSKTEYNNQERVLKYQISTTTLLELLKDTVVDLADQPNEISLSLKDGEVYEIKIDLSSYASHLANETKLTTYTLNYSNFGMVKQVSQENET